MDGVLQVAALLLTLGGAADRPGANPASAAPASAAPPPAAYRVPSGGQAARVQPSTMLVQMPADSWTGEDKFRHFAASWAAMVFTYSAARAVHDDSRTALAIALPVTGAFGIAKEVADRRSGGPFSFRDLTADALGAGAAWLFLREVR